MAFEDASQVTNGWQNSYPICTRLLIKRYQNRIVIRKVAFLPVRPSADAVVVYERCKRLCWMLEWPMGTHSSNYFFVISLGHAMKISQRVRRTESPDSWPLGIFVSIWHRYHVVKGVMAIVTTTVRVCFSNDPKRCQNERSASHSEQEHQWSGIYKLGTRAQHRADQIEMQQMRTYIGQQKSNQTDNKSIKWPTTSAQVIRSHQRRCFPCSSCVAFVLGRTKVLPLHTHRDSVRNLHTNAWAYALHRNRTGETASTCRVYWNVNRSRTKIELPTKNQQIFCATVHRCMCRIVLMHSSPLHSPQATHA